MAAVAEDGPTTFLSRRSRRYREMKDQVQNLSPAELLDLLAQEPTLLRSPILFDGRRVLVGFSDEGFTAFIGAL